MFALVIELKVCDRHSRAPHTRRLDAVAATTRYERATVGVEPQPVRRHPLVAPPRGALPPRGDRPSRNSLGRPTPRRPRSASGAANRSPLMGHRGRA